MRPGTSVARVEPGWNVSNRKALGLLWNEPCFDVVEEPKLIVKNL